MYYWLIDAVRGLMENGEHPFNWVHEAQGFW